MQNPRRGADNEETMSPRSARLLRTALAAVLGVVVLCCPAVDASAEPGTRGRPIVEFRSVELSEYPLVRVRFQAASPYPHFVEQDEQPHFHLVEVMDDHEWVTTPEKLTVLKDTADRLNLVMILDSTKSMSPAAFKSAVSSAKRLVAGLGAKDRAALYTLEKKGDPGLLTGFTGSQEKLASLLKKVRREGRVTRLYDTLYSGIYTAQGALGSAEASEEPGESRTLVLLLTDGREEDSFLTDDDCFELSELGRRFSIPVYVALYGKTKQSGESSAMRLLKRLTLKTGGRLLSSARPDQVADLLAEFRRLPRPFYEMSYRSPAAPDVWPGSLVSQRLVMQSNGAEYADRRDYRVPFLTFLAAKLANPLWLLAAVVLMILIVLLLFLLAYLRSRRKREDEQRSLATIPPVPPVVAVAEGEDGAEIAGYEDDLPDIAPYVISDDDVMPGEVRRPVAAAQAGVLMDGERTLYMREYTYRVTQMALRQARAYRRASLILDSRQRASREYDLFLDNTVIGSGRWANIPVRDEAVSPVHAKIKKIDNRFVVYDLLSASGVYLNGRRLLRPRGLNDGDELRIGRTRFIFRGLP